jgi:DNA-binding CsgD family transcriptional regulator
VRRQFDPVIWDGLKGLTGVEKTLMDEAREAGLYNGISLPLHGRDGDTFVFSIASDAGHDLRLKQHFPYVRLLAAQFFFRFNDLLAERQAPPPAPALTGREIECLQWACHGKSAWEIGTILHISEATVRFHLSNAFTKLGAPNRINAIVRAVRLGLISI